MVSLSFVGILVGGAAAAVASTTYPSSDEDISAAEEAYSQLENALNDQINYVESTHPGYDEYVYQVDEICHDPYELISYLTVMYGTFDFAAIENELSELFKKQYVLTLSEAKETRYRINEDGKRESYDWNILYIKLKNISIREVAEEEFTKEKLELFDTYTKLHGNRDGIFDESILPKDVPGYEIPPGALSDERFYNMISEAEKYLGYPYVWGGSSPETSFDCSGFVSWVINNSGNDWNVGRSTAEGLSQYTSYVSPEEARAGDLVFFKGTYSTSGASHVGIYVGNGMMIHCGDPIQYASIETPYWQKHFYHFGRLP